MRRLYRVIVWAAGSRTGRPGHPMYLPRELQGAGRVDNPELYTTLYVSTAPAGAIAEAFGRLPVWRPSMFGVPGLMPGAVRALATYRLGDDRVLDLDDPQPLLHRALRPSRVVTRDRAVTQRWARAIFGEGRWAGVAWWSYYDPVWTSVALWSHRALTPERRVMPLSPDHEAVTEAATILNRIWLAE